MDPIACEYFTFSTEEREKSSTKKQSRRDIMSENVHIHSGAPPPEDSPPPRFFRAIKAPPRKD
jgi:hypothetical protein